MPYLLNRARTGAYLLFFSGFLGGCSDDSETLRVPAPDAAEFESTVYPVLMRDCGFPECHGDGARFFRLYGPGRTRLDPDTPPFAKATPEELRHSYERARSMLATTGDLTDAPLLRKPLGTAAGSSGHEGTDNWGRDVYLTPADPGFQVLLSWARAAVSKGQQGGAP